MCNAVTLLAVDDADYWRLKRLHITFNSPQLKTLAQITSQSTNKTWKKSRSQLKQLSTLPLWHYWSPPSYLSALKLKASGMEKLL